MKVVYIAAPGQEQAAIAYRRALRRVGVHDVTLSAPTSTSGIRAAAEAAAQADIVHVFGRWRPEYGESDRAQVFLHVPIERLIADLDGVLRDQEAAWAVLTSTDPAAGAYADDVLWLPWPVSCDPSVVPSVRRRLVLSVDSRVTAAIRRGGGAVAELSAMDVAAIGVEVLPSWLMAARVVVDRLSGGPSWLMAEAAAHGAAVIWGAMPHEEDEVREQYGQDLPVQAAGLARIEDLAGIIAAIRGDEAEALWNIIGPRHTEEAVGRILADAYGRAAARSALSADGGGDADDLGADEAAAAPDHD